MLIEIGAPALLSLAMVRLSNEAGARTCMVCLTVQHPPVNLTARTRTQFVITGPRADLAGQQATQFLNYHALPQQADVEIDLAIPAFVGLHSDTILGLSVAHALAHVHDLPDRQRTTRALAGALDCGPLDAPAIWSFDRGGLLLVDVETPGLPAPRRRREITHDDRNAWALVFFLPRMPAETPMSFERERLDAHYTAAEQLDPGHCQTLVDGLWTAVADDDIDAAGEHLLVLQDRNHAACRAVETPLEYSADERAVLDLLRDAGAVAYGRSLTGSCLYGLVRGAAASIDLRKELRAHIGPFGGRILATITDNAGARSAIRE